MLMSGCTAELEGQLEKLRSNSRTSVSAAISGLKSAALALREHTEQMRRAIEVMCGRRDVISTYMW